MTSSNSKELFYENSIELPLLLLLQVCSKVFGSATGIVDMLVQHVPSSKDATAAKVARLYTGPQDPNSPLLQFMTGCSRTGQQLQAGQLLCAQPGCRELVTCLISCADT
jgi:hypothetical protein